jgi:hypothetical protein
MKWCPRINSKFFHGFGGFSHFAAEVAALLSDDTPFISFAFGSAKGYLKGGVYGAQTVFLRLGLRCTHWLL